MNIYITLDYELFFGESGSVENCMINPTKEILEVANRYDVKLNFFVDSGYLLALEKQKNEFQNLQKDYSLIVDQLRHLSKMGHGIELHIHPHWEDSFYDGSKWVFNLSRYKISSFDQDQIVRIVDSHVDILDRIIGKRPVAYRAGGWSAQPFDKIQGALIKNNILIDSSVFPKGKHKSKNQYYNYSMVPRFTTNYNFDKDITLQDDKGIFTEIPISSFKVKPWFFWNFAFIKLFKNPKHQPYGDGFAIKMPKMEMMRLLFLPSYTVVSIDGFKASLIEKAFNLYYKHTTVNDNFVLIGHPKAFTPYSINKVENFIKKHFKTHTFATFESIKNKNAIHK